MKPQTKELDKFYTNPKIIKGLLKKTEKAIKNFEYLNDDKLEWLEPSAGSGNFIDAIYEYFGENSKIKAYDLEPKGNKIIKKADFLNLQIKKKKNRIVIGNPPFGKRSKLAIEFINKSSEISDVVAFILPNQFVRFLTQKNINNNMKLIYQTEIEKNAFLVDDRQYNVNCVFQIWVNKDNESLKKTKDLRLYEKPTTSHKDFELMIHNNTEQTLKYFNKKKYRWNFAIHRQGYYDFTQILTKENELKKNRQYLFIKCNNEICEKVVHQIDKNSLTKWSTSIPGFSNEDFVREYINTKKRIKNEKKRNTKN